MELGGEGKLGLGPAPVVWAGWEPDLALGVWLEQTLCGRKEWLPGEYLASLDSRYLGQTDLLRRPGLEFLSWAGPGWLAGERGRVLGLVSEMTKVLHLCSWEGLR